MSAARQGRRRAVDAHDVGPSRRDRGRIVRQLTIRAHGDHVERRRGAQPRQDRDRPLEALVVGDQHLRSGVGEAVLHLGTRPPGVHADHRGTERHDGPVGDDPLRVVAHRDRDPVAALDATRVAEIVGERARHGADLGERVALVLVDDVRLVAVQRRQLPDRPHRGRRRVEDPHRDAAHVDLFHRERPARCDHLLPDSSVVLDHERR